MRRLLALLAIPALAACPTPETTEPDAGSSGGASSGTASGGQSSSSSSGGTSSSSSAVSGSGSSSSAAGGSSTGTASSAATASSQEVASSTADSSSSAPTSMMGRTFIWAHTNRQLYRVDAETLEATLVGQLEFLDEQMQPVEPWPTLLDLAVSGGGAMFGCSRTALWEIDPGSLKAYRRAPLTGVFTGLTFVPVGFLEADREVLVGATQNDGSLYRVDVSTGAQALIGTYGGTWQTSGDVVAVLGDGMYATVKESASATTDFLARIEPTTGVATIIGSQGIGATKVYGLGYWNSVLYGFSDAGDVLAINKQTGVGTVVTNHPLNWWGAGVTTLAKVN